MKKIFYIAIAALAVGMTAGCASPPPQADLDAAKAAMEQAVTAQAAEYAPESFNTAQEANTKLEAEMKNQESASATSRNYDEAKRLAAEVKTAAEKAVTDAQVGKDTMKAEAAAKMGEAHTQLEQVGAALAKAKVKAADMDKLKADLATVEAGLKEADGALKAEHYREANEKIASAMAAIDAVQKATQPSAKATR